MPSGLDHLQGAYVRPMPLSIGHCPSGVICGVTCGA